MDNWPVIAATGHRYLNRDARPWVDVKLHAAAVWLRDVHGMTVGISGMALGVDQTWADGVLAAGLYLHAHIPFVEQPDRWCVADRARWQRLIGQAAKVHVVGQLTAVDPDERRTQATQLLHARNDSMLDACTAIVAVLAGSAVRGGTVSAVAKARRRGLPIILLDPDRRRITVDNPDQQGALTL